VGRSGWCALATLAALAIALCVTVDDTVRTNTEDAVRAAFVTTFAARATALGAFVDRLAVSLGIAADAVSTHSTLPDAASFRRVRVQRVLFSRNISARVVLKRRYSRGWVGAGEGRVGGQWAHQTVVSQLLFSLRGF
jgi:hypothetical protein